MATPANTNAGTANATTRSPGTGNNGNAHAHSHAKPRPKVAGPVPLPDDYIVGPDGLVTAWVFYAPELAYSCLEKNAHNRKLRDHISRNYGRDMKTGNWPAHHQGIAFDEEGEVADGQHRLDAVFNSGTGQWFMTTWNLKPAAKKAVDSQLLRTALDVLHLDGNTEVANTHISTARRMFVGFGATNSETALTKSELEGWLVRHKDAIEFACCVFPDHQKGITTAGVMGLVARAYAHGIDQGKLRRFCEILHSCGYNPDKDGAGAAAVVALSKALNTKRHLPNEAYAKASRVLRAFLDGEELGHVYKAKKELFTLDDDARARRECEAEAK